MFASSSFASGQMCWMPVKSWNTGENVLHLRLNPASEWFPYFEMPDALQAEAKGTGQELARGFELLEKTGQEISPVMTSKGWFAYQHLLKKGWKIVPANIPALRP